MSQHRYDENPRSRPNHRSYRYRGFDICQDKHRGVTVWLVTNPLQRMVGLFEGPGSKEAAFDWVDGLCETGKSEEMLSRRPVPGKGGLLPDEPHPHRELWLRNEALGEKKS